MKRLDTRELKNTKGGFGCWFVAGLVAATVFWIGVVDGVVNPKKCG